MRFKFISETGDGCGFASRIADEGNDVQFWVRDTDAAAVGDGMFPKVGDLTDLFKDSDLSTDVFVFDTSGNGVMADLLRKQGYNVLGGSLVADRLEKDRSYAIKVMEESKIVAPDTFRFRDFDKAIDFVRERRKTRLVYKPSKKLGELSPSLTTSDWSELVELLENVKGHIHTEAVDFELQEFVEGLEISSEGWYEGDHWLPMFNHTFERKQLMPGNLGPSGGCTGNVVWACNGECPICKKGIRMLSPFLANEHYYGMIDLNGIYAEDKLYGLEFTPRFGYDAAPTLFFGLVAGDVGKAFANLAMNQPIGDNILDHDSIAAAVKITVPPWPTEKHLADADVPLRFPENEPSLDNVYWYNVKVTDGEVVTAGAWGITCLTIGVASTINRAFKEPYRLADGLRLQNKQYRNDLAVEFSMSMKELESAIHQHVG